MHRTRAAAVAFGVTLVVSAFSGASASADVSPTQHLPSAACNAGTMNAHSSVPETTGNGTPIFAHNAIPGTANVTPCGHGG
jgi:hypothetical protein